MMVLDDDVERQREVQDVIDGYDSSHEFIFDKMFKWGDLDAFAQSIGYADAQQMKDDFWAHHTDQEPDDKDFWDQLVIDYYA